MTAVLWREKKSLLSWERAAWHARSCGFTLTVSNRGQSLCATLERREDDSNGAIKIVAEKRVDAAGGGGSVTIIERQCAELRAWAEREAARQARKRA